jgi:hypothetical protein
MTTHTRVKSPFPLLPIPSHTDEQMVSCTHWCVVYAHDLDR